MRIILFFSVFCMTNDSFISVKSPDCFNELLNTTAVYNFFSFLWAVATMVVAELIIIVFVLLRFRFRIWHVLLKIHRYFVGTERVHRTEMDEMTKCKINMNFSFFRFRLLLLSFIVSCQCHMLDHPKRSFSL